MLTTESNKKAVVVKKVRIADLVEYGNNPRRNDDAVDYVENSIRSFGFRVPLVIDKDNVIVAGHTRYKAAKRLGMKTVPCIVADDLTEDEINAYRLADNRTQELSSWDFSKLMDELCGIDEFDMGDFGFAKTEDDEEETERSAAPRKSNLDEGYEVDLSDFDEEQFECECPECGFRFNE